MNVIFKLGIVYVALLCICGALSSVVTLLAVNQLFVGHIAFFATPIEITVWNVLAIWWIWFSTAVLFALAGRKA